MDNKYEVVFFKHGHPACPDNMKDGSWRVKGIFSDGELVYAPIFDFSELEDAKSFCADFSKPWNLEDRVAIVIDENMLCFILPNDPSRVQIMAGSVIRGALYGWQDGVTLRPSNRANERPANAQDFKDFRRSTVGFVLANPA